jgi:hypothetical protein
VHLDPVSGEEVMMPSGNLIHLVSPTTTFTMSAVVSFTELIISILSVRPSETFSSILDSKHPPVMGFSVVGALIDKFGKANNCAHGKGGGWANEVYEVPGWHHYFLSAHWIKMHQMALQRMRQIRAEQAKRARYQRLMKTQRVRFNKAVAAYNASVKRLHTYNNKRNVALANARRYNHMYTVYKQHRAAQLRAAAAQRAQCAKAQAAMNKNAASHAANMRKYKALYNRYNNQARTYTNNYNRERVVMMRTNKARVSAMNTLNKYTGGYNAANKRVARLNG